MSRFYASVASERKPKTLQGLHKISAHVRTWDHGIRVEYKPSLKLGLYDCFIYETGGSNDASTERLIKTIKGVKAENKRPGSSYYGHAFGGTR